MSISIKVSELAVLNQITSDDYIIVNDSGSITTYRASIATFATWMTGSGVLVASSSYSLLAVSSSYALSASWAISSSYAVSSSYAKSSSYSVNSTNSTNSTSASYAVSSSYAASASYVPSGINVLSASYATSASYAVTGSYYLSGSFSDSASVAVTSSYSLSSSYSRTTLSASYSLSSSYALTASFAVALVGGSPQFPIGGLLDFAGSDISSFGVDSQNWAVCTGSVLSITTYASLYSAIGTLWNTGGEPVGYFRLPDLRRRISVGAGGSISSPSSSLQSTDVGGTNSLTTETHTTTIAETAYHNHPITSYGTTTPSNGNGQITGGNDVTGPFTYNEAPAALIGPHTSIAAAGNSNPHNNMQPSAIVNKIIRIK